MPRGSDQTEKQRERQQSRCSLRANIYVSKAVVADISQRMIVEMTHRVGVWWIWPRSSSGTPIIRRDVLYSLSFLRLWQEIVFVLWQIHVSVTKSMYIFIPGIPGPPRALSGGLMPPPYAWNNIKKEEMQQRVFAHGLDERSNYRLPVAQEEPSLWAESFSAQLRPYLDDLSNQNGNQKISKWQTH